MIYRIVCRVLPLVMIVTLLAGCRSKKDNVQPDIRIEEVAENVAPWRNVYLPVKVELLSPKRFAMSGRATMVWNESIYLSMRMFGFEVGTAYADSSEAVVTLRQPQKVMIELPLSDLLKNMMWTWLCSSRPCSAHGEPSLFCRRPSGGRRIPTNGSRK